MANATYSTEALVLRKTNLGESDLIVRMMGPSGSLIEGVAKGARRPQGSLSGRVELFNRVEVHCAKGRSLDVIKEARLIRAGQNLHVDPAHGAAAACIAEFASRTIQPDLEVRSYFDLTDAAFSAADASDGRMLPLVVAAYVFKASAMMGMRPSFSRCVLCGAELPPDVKSHLSYIDGGFVCDGCAGTSETVAIGSNILLWADMLLRSTFAEILEGTKDAEGDVPTVELLQIADQWAISQAEVRMRSAATLLSYISML